MGRNPEFELWLEVETGEPDQPANRPTANFCNVEITLVDGRRYALNVWTFDFLPLSRFPRPYDEQDDTNAAKYVVAPDLFVERLDRESLREVVSEILAEGELKAEWLCSDEQDV